MKEKIVHVLTSLSKVSDELPEGRVFALDGQAMISAAIQILNVVVLFAVLFILLYKPVKKILSKRTEHIEGRLQEIELGEQKAQALIATYEAKFAEIDEERQRLIKEAKKEAEEEKKQIIAKSREEAEKIKEDAKKSLETERLLLQRNAKDYVLELSTLLAERTLKDSVSKEALDEQFEEGLKSLEVSSWRN